MRTFLRRFALLGAGLLASCSAEGDLGINCNPDGFGDTYHLITSKASEECGRISDEIPAPLAAQFRAACEEHLKMDIGLKYARDLSDAGVLMAWSSVENLRDAIVNARAKHGDDIPGVGWTRFLTSMLGAPGRLLLSQEAKNIGTELRFLLITHVKINESDKASVSFREILGSFTWDTDQNLLHDIERARECINKIDSIIARRTPENGIKWYERNRGGRPWTRPIDWQLSKTTKK